MKLTKQRVILGILAVLFLVLTLTFGLRLRYVTNLLPSQQAGERWGSSDDGGFAQISAFFPADGMMTADDIARIRAAIYSNLVMEGMANTNWIYAYSADGSLTVSARGRTGAVHAYATGVGGEFFFFYPVPFTSGAPFSADDWNRDLIVIDESLAWDLFGALDVAGLEVVISGQYFRVAGVYRTPTDFASRRAYPMPHLFLHYDTLVSETDFVAIGNFQAVLPNTLSGMAERFMENALDDAGVAEFEIINNTERYQSGALWQIIRQFGGRSMQSLGLRLPHWENAARVVEDTAALLFLLVLLSALYPSVILGMSLVILWRNRRFRVRDLWKWVAAHRERRKEEKWLKDQY